ncbi:hypothetical protein V2W45_1523704 [Cenococcum geophilum]
MDETRVMLFMLGFVKVLISINIISKEHFTSLYSPIRKIAFTLKNIKAGFAVSGLFPFNPDRVLRSMPAPLAKPAILRADEVKVGSYWQDLLVLGKAKVMSYKDLKEARAKCVVKEATRAAKGKGKRGRKRKSGTLEAEEDTAETARRGRKRKSAALDAPAPTNKMARISNAPKPAKPQRAPEPLRAPVARIW